MPHIATLVGGDTAIAGFPFFLSCSCGVQGRFSTAIEATRYVGIHFIGQNQSDTLQFTDNSGGNLPLADNSTTDEGSVPEDAGTAQQ